MPFHGFSDKELESLDGTEFFAHLLYFSEMSAVLEQLGNRMGGNVLSTVQHAGRDTQAGRDYFFDQIEIRRRGAASGPSMIGYYHYRSPEDRKGSWFEAWRSAHDDAPRLRRPLREVVAGAREAFRTGSQSWLDDFAAEIRDALGL